MTGKSFLPTFWDDADAAALKAYKSLSMDNLSLLMAKSSNEVMSSHIQVYVNNVGFSLSFSFTLPLLREFSCRLWGSSCLFLGSF